MEVSVNDTLRSLQSELARARQELEIVLALDHVRDSAEHPATLLADVVDVMITQFDAELGVLYLLAAETERLDLKAWRQRGTRGHAQPDLALSPETLQELMTQEGVTSLYADAQELHVVALPIFMREEPLGVLLIARQAPSFEVDEVALLEAAELHVDSAIVQARRAYELAQRNKELETIYRLDHVRDQGLPFDEMLNRVLHELTETLQAELGFVLLYDRAGQELEMRASTHDDLSYDMRYQGQLRQMAEAAVKSGELQCASQENGACDAICVPLILRDEIIGVFGVAERLGRGEFLSDERRLLRAIVSQMDTAILESLERRRLRQLLGRSVDPNVLSRLLAHPDVGILSGERTHATVLYADLRGSTQLAERLAPEQLVAYINAYLEQMTEVILKHEGTLDKFVGDEVMALFGAPLAQDDHALRAVQVGLEMQERYRRLMQAWQSKGIEVVSMGVGIATGEMIVGEVGCERRADYTAIGRVVNLGARICSVALPDQVLISDATYQAIRNRIDAVPQPGVRFKGVEEPVTIYEVSGVW
jgi:adenylate cyclase